jgi:hypothetical protein
MKKKNERREKGRTKKREKMASLVTVSGANSHLLELRMIKSPLELTFHLKTLVLKSKNEF